MKKNDTKYNIKTYSSSKELESRLNFAKHFIASPIPEDQILSNLGLFINSKTLSRMLFMDHLYKQVVNVMGSVFEFGTRWGPNAAQFVALRGIYEPFNRHRKIVAFDTFTGFPTINPEDEMSADANKEFIEEVKKQVNQEKQLLILCKAGGRSMMAAQLLSQEKIKCINISDGFEGNGENLGWKQEGLPSK